MLPFLTLGTLLVGLLVTTLPDSSFHPIVSDPDLDWSGFVRPVGPVPGSGLKSAKITNKIRENKKRKFFSLPDLPTFLVLNPDPNSP
jgi:hypothetical protein